MWNTKQSLSVICLFVLITVSQQQSLGCSKNCTLQVLNEDIRHSITRINDEECNSMQFSRTADYQLSKFNMKSSPYIGKYRNFSTIHLTFSEIEWHYLKIRIKARTSEKASICQELKLPDGLKFSNEAQVQLNCRSFCVDNQVLDIEYMTHENNKEENKGYATKIPNFNRIKNDSTYLDWEVFTYVDVTKIPKLTLYWQNLPEQFGVKSYTINMTNADTGYVIKTIQVLADPTLNIMVQEFNVVNSGKFHFTVQPENGNKTMGFVTHSAKVYMDLRSQMYIFWLAGTGAVIISVLLLILFLKIQINPDQSPVVLMLYERTRESHIEAMVAFAKFLQDVCHVNAKIDEIDIRSSGDMDPFEWNLETFKNADVVMVITSPPKISTHEIGPYRNLCEVGLNLMAENFGDEHQKFICVLLPYCTEKNIPKKAKILRRFKLFKDLDEMVWYMHQGRKFPRLSKFYFLTKLMTCRKKIDLQSEGKTLLDAFKNAAEDVKNPLTPFPVIQTTFERIPTEEPIGFLDAIPLEIPSEDNSDYDEEYPGPISNLIEQEHLRLNSSQNDLQENVRENEQSTQLDIFDLDI